MRNLILGAALCTLTTLAAATVSISSPTNGSSVSTSVHVTSSTTSSNTITTTKIYVDNSSVYSVSSSSIDTDITVSTGAHSITVQSWDNTGATQHATVSVTATASSSAVPSNAKKYANIEQMTGWQSCDACAGAGGNGPSAYVKMTQGLTSPSLDGKASQFYLKGSTAYANALWWKQLGANSSVSNFSYDLYFYLKNPSAAQALEFDVNQSLNGKKYIFGTECDIKDKHVWNIYDAYHHKWMATSVACSAPKAYAWNHLVLEFQRTNGQMKFVAITLNGKKSYFNKLYAPTTSSSGELNVAVQIDSDGQNTPYSEWADKINLYAW